jgi:type IV pilus assembly protein PilY1
MRAPIATTLLAAAVLAGLPDAAGADYLYSTFRNTSHDPYVMFILDNSGSMSYDNSGKPGTQTDSEWKDGKRICPYGTKEVADEDCDCRWDCDGGPLYCLFPWNWKWICEDCSTDEVCKSRADAATEVLSELVSNLDGAEMGFIHFNSSDYGGGGCNYGEARNACGRTHVASPGGEDNRTTILSTLSSLAFNTNTPLALALEDAKTRLEAVAAADDAAACRGYYVILLTDGEDNCCKDPDAAALALRSIAAGNRLRLDVRTFVIGFGRDVKGSTKLSQIARAGGTARHNGQWECWDPTGTRTGVPSTCTRGSALFAGDTNELKAALGQVFAAIRSGYYTGVSPVIGTVPQVKSETDRVARNLMAYTAFDMPGHQGHLFGVRLFQETQPEGLPTGAWEFTDFTRLDLDTCGAEGNPCVFDGGKRLYDRVRTPGAKARRIWTAEPFTVDYLEADGDPTTDTGLGIRLVPKATPLELTRDDDGAEALKTAADLLFSHSPFKGLWDDRNTSTGIKIIDARYPERLEALREDSPDRRGQILSWLHGDPWMRPWPLGDPYHAGAAIVEAPPYPYRTRGYPIFRSTLRNRPAMIYLPANDGMIHAFHAGPDLEKLHEKNREKPTCAQGERWCPGDEAWAYLPTSLLARAAVEILGDADRFFSMDLSCRIDDVLLHDNRTDDGGFDCDKDPVDPALCGWRSVLLCGQGWGGNWYVALDVTRPLQPKPLWELTFDEGNKGFGRTWSLPGIAVLQRGGFPVWMAVAGNGYNTDLRADGGTSHPAYRLLNLPFAGTFAHHGDGTEGDDDHVYTFDVATGTFLRRFDTDLKAVVADIPAVDVDRDGFTESAYVAGWKGEIHRIGFGGGNGAREAESPANWGYCGDMFKFSGGNPVPNRPVMMLDPRLPERLYLIAASGQDKGSFPDDAGNSNASYDLDGWFFDDDGGTTCSAVSVPKGNGNGNENKGNGNENKGNGNTGGSGNMCKDPHSGLTMNGLFNQGEGKRRLMGAPIIAGQANGERWLSFTAWEPPADSCGDDGEGSLYCLKWSNDPSSCGYCGDLSGDDQVDGDDESIVISREIPPPPISADGQIYVATEDGLLRVANQDGQSGGASNSRANTEAPRNVVVSWREVFPSPVVAEEAEDESSE